MAITSRPCRPSDLASLRALMTGQWKKAGRHVSCHLGDLAWGMSRRPEETIRLWFDDGELAGFSHLAGPRTLDLMLDPDHPEALRAVLAWLTRPRSRPDSIQSPIAAR
jgi:hypothetical protein